MEEENQDEDCSVCEFYLHKVRCAECRDAFCEKCSVPNTTVCVHCRRIVCSTCWNKEDRFPCCDECQEKLVENRKGTSVQETKPGEIDILIFHKNCGDGFGAALACHIYCKRYGHKEPTYRAMSHDEPVPVEDCKEKNVAIFDFAFSREGTEQILAVCKSFTLWDHHESNDRHLGGLPHCHFATLASGAVLAWNYFFPYERVPLFIRYVEDRDLWKWELPDSRYVSRGSFYDLDMDFDKWEVMCNPETEEKKVRELAEHGKLYDGQQKKIIGSKPKFAQKVTFHGFSARSVNTPHFVSEMGEAILEAHSDCKVAVVWNWDDFKRGYKVHLRSRESDEDANVSLLAEKYGGGGHAHSAAFSWKSKTSIDGLWDPEEKKDGAEPEPKRQKTDSGPVSLVS